MMATLPNDTNTDATRFNALCDVVIYHFCDVCRKAGNEQSKSAKLLVEQNVMEDTEDGEAAYTEYEELVKEYMLGHLPDGFGLRYDYWGAPCITDIQNGTVRHDKMGGRVFAAGDSCGRIMLFDNFEALQTYTQECLESIE